MDSLLTYKKGSSDDLQQLKDLGLAAYRQYSTVLSADNWSTFEESLQNESELQTLISNSEVFVCRNADQEIVGMVFLIPSGRESKLFLKEWSSIRRLAVHSDYRGRGIAKELTALCISRAREMNEKTLALHTSEFMDAARRIYEDMGFVKVRQVDGLYGKKYWIYCFDL